LAEGNDNYQKAEKDVKDDVGAVVKALKANPKLKREGGTAFLQFLLMISSTAHRFLVRRGQ